MNDYLSFRKMITPVLIQGIFWIGVLAVLVNAFMMFDNILLALLGAAFGTVIWRVYCEIMIVLFRMLDVLTDIRNERNPPAG